MDDGLVGLFMVRYSGGMNIEHWNTEHFEVMFSNVPKTRWPPVYSVFQWSRPLENQAFGYSSPFYLTALSQPRPPN